MAACVWPVTRLGLSDPLTLLIQVPLGVLIYAGASWIFKVDSFRYMLDVLKQFLSRKEGTQ